MCSNQRKRVKASGRELKKGEKETEREGMCLFD